MLQAVVLAQALCGGWGLSVVPLQRQLALVSRECLCVVQEVKKMREVIYIAVRAELWYCGFGKTC